MNSKLHAVCNGNGKPLPLALTQVSDYKGVATLLDSLSETKELLADRGYDAVWFRNALLDKGITPCIPSKKNRKQPYTMIKTFTGRDTKLRLCSVASRTGAGLPCVTIGAHTLSFQQYVSPVPLSFILINES